MAAPLCKWPCEKWLQFNYLIKGVLKQDLDYEREKMESVSCLGWLASIRQGYIGEGNKGGKRFPLSYVVTNLIIISDDLDQCMSQVN